MKDSSMCWPLSTEYCIFMPLFFIAFGRIFDCNCESLRGEIIFTGWIVKRKENDTMFCFLFVSAYPVRFIRK